MSWVPFTSPLRARLAVSAALTLILLGPWIFGFATSGEVLAYHLDTDVYRQGAWALREDSGLYRQLFDVRDNRLPFTYPPLAALLFVPLTWVPLPVAGLIMTLVSLAALVLTVVVVLRALRLSRTWALGIVPLAAAFEPVRDTISFGQVNLVLMALVTVDALGRRRLSTGALAGLAAAIKLTPAVFIVYFLLRRDFRSAGVMVASASATTLATAAVLPQTSWEYFTDVLLNTSRIGSPWYSKNQSLAGALARFLDPETADAYWLVGVVAILAVGILAGWRVRRNRTLLLGVVALISMLCSPVSWSHHWVWLIVVALAFVPAALKSWSARLIVTAITVLAIIPPHLFLRHDDAIELEWTLPEHLLGNSFVLLAAGLLGWLATRRR